MLSVLGAGLSRADEGRELLFIFISLGLFITEDFMIHG